LIDSEGVRLRIALEELGPLFVAFGHYLGSRVDLLPLATCTTLAQTRFPTALDALTDTMPAVEGVDIEPTPLRRGILHRWHRGVFDKEQAVIVKTVRTNVVTAFEEQIDELPVLETLRLADLDNIEDPVEDFLVWLERQLDLRRDLRGLQRLASEAPNFDAIVVPRLWEERSSHETLVYADPGGTTLREAVETATEDDEDNDRARGLCSAWLQQVLLESVLPEGPPEDNLCLLDDGRVAITGGLFSSLGRKPRLNLLRALIATSRGDPDRACDHLLRACNVDIDGSDRDRLQVLFRQAEPFRDGGWSESYRGRRMADTLYVQWRLLRREGIEIPQSVVSYIQSLHQIERCARNLSPDHDSFADAVDDLGVVSAASRLRETFSVSRVRGVLEAAVPVLQELAEKADKIGTGRTADTSEKKSTREFRWRQWSETAGLLLLMVATVVTAQQLRAAGFGGEWVQGLSSAFFVVLAIVVLWRIWRQG
jgi:ubiquinone biosynthesis protein